MSYETVFPEKAAAVVKSDSTRFKTKSTIYVGTGGNVVVIPWGNEKDTPITFAIGDGGVVPVAVRAVLDASTAVNMVRVF